MVLEEAVQGPDPSRGGRRRTASRGERSRKPVFEPAAAFPGTECLFLLAEHGELPELPKEGSSCEVPVQARVDTSVAETVGQGFQASGERKPLAGLCAVGVWAEKDHVL